MSQTHSGNERRLRQRTARAETANKALSSAEFDRLKGELGDERLLSREQAAEFLGVSPRSVDGWAATARGLKSKAEIPRSRLRLPHIKLGRRLFFQLGDLRQFLEERKVTA